MIVTEVGRGRRQGELLQQLVLDGILTSTAIVCLPSRDVRRDPDVAANIFCTAEISNSLSPESPMTTSRSPCRVLGILS